MVLRDGRRGSRLCLSAPHRTHRGLLGRTPARRQPLFQLAGGARRQDRRACVALSDGPSRCLGIRHRRTRDARRDHCRRQANQGGDAAQQDRVPLRLRSPDRGARLADRGTPGAAVERARGATIADAAVPDQAPGVRHAGLQRRRLDRFYSRVAGARPRAHRAVLAGSDVHAAVGRRRRARSQAGHADQPGRLGLGQLEHGCIRPRDRVLLRRLAHHTERAIGSPSPTIRRRRSPTNGAPARAFRPSTGCRSSSHPTDASRPST